MALAALRSYDLDVRRVRLLQNSWNCVFRLDTPDGPRVLRVTLPGHTHDQANVASEATFLEAVADGAGLFVPRPVRNRRGELVTEASAAGVPEPRLCTVFTWVGGRELAHDVSPANWRLLGDLMARLHRFAERWTPPPSFVVPTYDSITFRPEPQVLFTGDVDLGDHAALLEDAWHVAEERLTAVARRDTPVVVHGDLHQRHLEAGGRKVA